MLRLPPQNLAEEEEEAEVVIARCGCCLTDGGWWMVGVIRGPLPQFGPGGHEHKDNMFVAAFAVVLFFCRPRNLHAGIYLFIASSHANHSAYLLVYTVVIVRLLHVFM